MSKFRHRRSRNRDWFPYYGLALVVALSSGLLACSAREETAESSSQRSADSTGAVVADSSPGQSQTPASSDSEAPAKQQDTLRSPVKSGVASASASGKVTGARKSVTSSSPASPSSTVRRSSESARDTGKPPARSQPASAQPPVISQPAAAPPATPLPNEPQPATGTQAPDSLLASAAEYEGWKTWHVYCYRCHGVDAVGGQLAPDLRRSVSSEGGINRESFITVVKEGRVEKGMPAWSTLLSDDQIVNVYAYVKARSERRLAAGRPHTQQ